MASAVPEQTAKIFDRLPNGLAMALQELRALVIATAADNPAIGPLEETLKWGEPAFLPSTTRSGTTIRINRHKKSATHYALYVPCSTNLVDRYRGLYSDILAFEGDRAILFDIADPLPVEPVTHCIAMALTYHLRSG